VPLLNESPLRGTWLEMKVRIADIPPQGLPISATMSLEALNTRMNEARNNDIVFTSAPKVTLTIFKALGGAESKGTVKTTYRRPCGLCLDELDRELTIKADFIIKDKPPTKRPRELERATKNTGATKEKESEPILDDGEFADDVGIFFYEGDNFELEGPLQELLILALPAFWHPHREKVSGNCSHCGKNPCPEREPEAEPLGKLGEIFKKVGLN
jgi:hypothetical protein